MTYIIHKSTRTPGKVSYDGPTWDMAGIRKLRKDVYLDKELAAAIASMLAEHNPVGFTVTDLDTIKAEGAAPKLDDEYLAMIALTWTG